jgi:hypothetical protein
MGLCGALAIHIVDEVVTDFFTFQTQAILDLREQYPWLPLPVFTFENWLALLIFAVVSLSAVSAFVWYGAWAMRPISYAFAGFMFLNGLLHIFISIYMRELISGVYTSPLLLVASVILIVSTRAHKWKNSLPPSGPTKQQTQI